MSTVFPSVARESEPVEFVVVLFGPHLRPAPGPAWLSGFDHIDKDTGIEIGPALVEPLPGIVFSA